MLFFNRSDNDDEPKALDSTFVDEDRHRLHNFLQLPLQKRLQTDAPVTGSLPERLSMELIDELESLSHRRCAFCERINQNLMIYRFRPDGNATPLKRPEDRHHYVWLRWQWTNLFPICQQCRPATETEFPVAGRRASHYPSPWAKDEHLYVESGEGSMKTRVKEQAGIYCPGPAKLGVRRFTIDDEWNLAGLTKIGTATLQHFNLLREKLVQRRRQQMALNLTQLTQRLSPDEPSSVSMAPSQADLFDFESLEFGGTWYLLLRRLAKQVNSAHGIESSLGPARLQNSFQHGSPNLAELLDLIERARQSLEPRKSSESGVESGAEEERTGNTMFGQSSQLRSVSVCNFRSLESIKLELPIPAAGDETGSKANAPCLLLLGENSAGKSSFLEAVALAAIGHGGREKLQADTQDQVLVPEYLGSSGVPAPSSAKVTLEFAGALLGSSGKLEMSLPETELVTRPTFAAPPVFAYGPHRVFGGHDTYREPTDIRVRTLFNTDEKLPNPERWLVRLATGDDTSALNEVVSALRSIIQIDGDFSHIEVKEGRCYIHLAKTLGKKSYLVEMPLDRVSSGYRSVIAIICNIFDGLMGDGQRSAATARRCRALVLIDEIEAHLHPRWKLQLVNGLRQAFPQITFIMTTHDPLCVRGMLPGEVAVLSRHPTQWQSETRSLYKEVVIATTNLPDPRELTVGQLLASDLFGMYTTNDVVKEEALAAAADLLAEHGGELPEDIPDKARSGLRFIQSEIDGSLPIGTSEIRQLVQLAIADYLQARRETPLDKRATLRQQAKKRIAKALDPGRATDEGG